MNIKNKTIISFSVPFKFHVGLGEQKEARNIVNLNVNKICQEILKKKIVGIDFDNTIISYVNVFKKLLRKNKIQFGKKLNKEIFKKKIIKKYNEKFYTKIQSEIYGENIFYARKFANLNQSLII